MLKLFGITDAATIYEVPNLMLEEEVLMLF
jgi:hypothetical protein